jgi:hypothetical protein
MQMTKKVGRVRGTQIAAGQELCDGVDDLYAQAPQLPEGPGRSEDRYVMWVVRPRKTAARVEEV